MKRSATIAVALTLATASLTTATVAQAAARPASTATAATTCSLAWQTATWGKAKLCPASPDSSGRDRRIYGQIMDTKTDGYCVELRYGVSGSDAWQGAKTACTLNQAVSYDFTAPSGRYVTTAQLAVFDNDGHYVHYMTLYDYSGGCGISPAVKSPNTGVC